MGKQYQRGSVRKVKRASGKRVWEWRYRIKGVMKQESFEVAGYPTLKCLWLHLQTRLALRQKHSRVGGGAAARADYQALSEGLRGDKHKIRKPVGWMAAGRFLCIQPARGSCQLAEDTTRF